jgi:antitoxin HigA-1
LRPLDISQNKLARDLGVPVARINDIIHAKRGISADTALGLSAHFKTSPEFWLNLQTRYDLKIAERKVGADIVRAVRPFEPAAP